MLVRDNAANSGWQDSTTLFGYSFNVTGALVAPAFDAVSVSAPVLLADGQTQYDVTLQASDSNGVIDLRDMRVMFDRDFVTPSKARGYLAWGKSEADVTFYGGTMTVQGPAVGGGYWGFDTGAWGAAYITPLSCSTATSGNQRTVTWSFRVSPAWAADGPKSGNFVGMFARDYSTSIGWLDGNVLFGHTFDVLQPVTFVPSDLDHDGDVDGSDYGLFSGCFNGSGNPPPPGCSTADLNGDGSIDGLDYGLFSACFNGSGNPPACSS
jgi:hypothetical protein